MPHLYSTNLPAYRRVVRKWLRRCTTFWLGILKQTLKYQQLRKNEIKKLEEDKSKPPYKNTYIHIQLCIKHIYIPIDIQYKYKICDDSAMFPVSRTRTLIWLSYDWVPFWFAWNGHSKEEFWMRKERWNCVGVWDRLAFCGTEGSVMIGSQELEGGSEVCRRVTGVENSVEGRLSAQMTTLMNRKQF